MALGVYSVLYDFGHLIGTGIGWWSSIMKGRVWWPGRADLAESSNFPVVLLVEDEWLIRADMAAGLEEAGWEVVEASTGEGAIEQLCNGLDIGVWGEARWQSDTGVFLQRSAASVAAGAKSRRRSLCWTF
jgi:hypothetical protein